MKPTGFKVYREDLLVGDIISVHSGYCGYMEVVERADGFWLTDCTDKVLGHHFPENEKNADMKIERDLGVHYCKVDKDNPTEDPPFPIYCDQCDDVITAYSNAYSGEITQTDDCAELTEKSDEDGEINIVSKCKLCKADPSRKPPANEVMEYFAEQYEKADFRVVPGHWPSFNSKEEIDDWLNVMKNMCNC